MNRNRRIRSRVSRSYARAISTPKASCCGTPSSSEPKGAASKLAGYDADDLAQLPHQAVENSFGCGNPVAFGDIQEGEVILDLGSGAGIDLLLAAQKVGSSGRVIGVDMTEEMIERARQTIADSGHDNIEVRRGLIESLPVEDESVDLVISNCVINLSPEKDRVFREIARVLKPGGRMRVSDIVVERLPRWVRAIPSVYDSCVGGAISEAAYLDGLRRAGLEGVAVRERLVYDERQLTDLVISELPGRGTGIIQRLGLTRIVRRLVRSVTGRVWSARFFAAKPAVVAGAESRAPLPPPEQMTVPVL